MARVIPLNEHVAEDLEVSSYLDEPTTSTISEELFSVEEVRAIEGCEDFGEEQAKEVINTLSTFAQIIINSISGTGTIVGTTINIEQTLNNTSKAA